jgi:hypothetical protein
MSLVTFVAGNVLEAQQLNDSFAAVNVIKALSTNTVATSQTTSSTSYTDLATTGPTVTLTTGTSALVLLTCSMTNAGGANSVSTSMGFAVSGATTIAAADTARLFVNTVGANGQALQASVLYQVTLTAGSNTFTAKYKAGAAQTVTFSDRVLAVITL